MHLLNLSDLQVYKYILVYILLFSIRNMELNNHLAFMHGPIELCFSFYLYIFFHFPKYLNVFHEICVIYLWMHFESQIRYSVKEVFSYIRWFPTGIIIILLFVAELLTTVTTGDGFLISRLYRHFYHIMFSVHANFSDLNWLWLRNIT